MSLATAQTVQQHRAKVAVLEHLTSLLAPVDSMLRSWPTQTMLTNDTEGLAQAQGDTIAFSRAAIDELANSSDDLRGLGMRLAAGNYRAVAALDLNIASDVAPFRHARAWSPAHKRAFYSAEVARLETQYSGVYPALKTIFTFDVSNILAGMLKAPQSERVAQVAGTRKVLPAFAMVAMRPYLDIELFNQLYQAALDAGTDEDVLDEVTRIGEEFVKLRWPEDAETGRKLSERLSELVDFPEESAPECGVRGQSAKRDNGEMKDRGAQAGKDQVDDSNDPQESPDNADQSGQDGQGDSDGQDGDQDGQGSPKDALDQARDRLDKLGAGARSSGEGSRMDKLTEQAAAAAGVGLDSAAFTHEMVEVPNDAKILRGQLTSVFMDLIDQTAGGVSYGTKRGKMVPLDRRMGRRRYRSTVTPNRRNELSIDLALLIDVSGSMGGHQQALGKAVWAIKGGIDDVATRARGLAKARVWSYNYGSSLFMAEVRRLHPNLMAVPTTDGGTSPVKSLREAREWLTKSSARTRMLVMLTDGAWEGQQEADRLVKEIGKLPGATSVLFGLGGAVQHYGSHGFEHSMDLTSLTPMASITRGIIRKNLKDRVGV